jgi:hypothetical protein
MGDPVELSDELAVARLTWTVTPHGKLLHAVRVLDGSFDDGPAPAVTACGRRTLLVVPGLFTRMGARRCDRCCDAVGLPHGTGSPKNDPVCRQRLGLDDG